MLTDRKQNKQRDEKWNRIAGKRSTIWRNNAKLCEDVVQKRKCEINLILFSLSNLQFFAYSSVAIWNSNFPICMMKLVVCKKILHWKNANAKKIRQPLPQAKIQIWEQIRQLQLQAKVLIREQCQRLQPQAKVLIRQRCQRLRPRKLRPLKVSPRIAWCYC